jgi:hypothetical protein
MHAARMSTTLFIYPFLSGCKWCVFVQLQLALRCPVVCIESDVTLANHRSPCLCVTRCTHTQGTPDLGQGLSLATSHATVLLEICLNPLFPADRLLHWEHFFFRLFECT